MIINFSASPQLAKLVSHQAAVEQKTKSELLRDAVKAYIFDQRLSALQEIGRVVAEKLNLESYDHIEKYIEDG